MESTCKVQPNKTVIRNTLVEGAMRPSKDLYLETDPKDLPARSNYKMPRNGNKPIPKDVMLPLSEDGIRVYTRGGSVTVENCTVKKMRGGIRLYLASRATVTNSTAIDCGNTNFNMTGGGKITGSTGNFAYAPLSDFRLSKSKQNIELTILPSPHAVGPHNVADILGNNHNIVFHRSEGPIDTDLRPIVVKGDNSTIRNETEYPIILQSSASGNTVVSFGPVTDRGTNNKVSRMEQRVSKVDKVRGRFSSIYERVYHHYHDRMGLEMPFTAQVNEKIRPERWRSSHASWGALMHAGQPSK